MKNILLALLLMLSFLRGYSQPTEPTLVLYEFNNSQAPVYNNTVVNASTLNVFNYNLTSAYNPNYKFHNVQTTQNTDYYLYLQVGPRSGRVLNLSKFIFDLGKDIAPAGSNDVIYEVRTSLDGYTSVLASGSGGAAQHIEIPLGPSFKSIPGLLEFRIYIYNHNTAISDVYNVDNIDIRGVAEPAPAPGPVTLPVSMLFFDGKYDGTKTKLSWATASEISNDHFDIERSKDGITFTKIGEVKGNGTSVLRNNYAFTDHYSATVIYYRIKQVDFDGAGEYFRIIAINGRFQANMFNVYQSSGKNIVSIKEDHLNFQLFDLNGKLVLASALTKGHHDLKARAGIYIAVLTNGNDVQKKRVMLY